MSSKQKNAQLRDLVFRLSAMFPALSIDTVTAAVLSEDGHFERTLAILHREASRTTTTTTTTTTALAAAPVSPAEVLSARELALLAAAEEKSENQVDNGADLLASVDARAAPDVKYRHYEAVVLALADSFPHVPLDDVWTACIVHKGSRVEAAAHLLQYEQPVTPVTVPLADRHELDEVAAKLAPPRSRRADADAEDDADAAHAHAQQLGLRESLDAARDDAVVHNAEQLPLVFDTTASVGPSPDELLALALQREEEEAANLAAIQRMKWT